MNHLPQNHQIVQAHPYRRYQGFSSPDKDEDNHHHLKAKAASSDSPHDTNSFMEDDDYDVIIEEETIIEEFEEEYEEISAEEETIIEEVDEDEIETVISEQGGQSQKERCVPHSKQNGHHTSYYYYYEDVEDDPKYLELNPHVSHQERQGIEEEFDEVTLEDIPAVIFPPPLRSSDNEENHNKHNSCNWTFATASTDGTSSAGRGGDELQHSSQNATTDAAILDRLMQYLLALPSKDSNNQVKSKSSVTTSSSTSLSVMDGDRDRRIADLISTINSTAHVVDGKSFEHTDIKSSDYIFLSKVQDFHRARFLRREKFTKHSMGVFGLFCYLVDLRVDLKWAEDAAWRRANGKPYLSWVDFESQHRRHYHRPYFCFALMAVWSLTMVLALSWNGGGITSLRVNPFLGPEPDVLVKMGALNAGKIIENREWSRLASPSILHAGLLHFMKNMLSLWFVGGAVERMHGSVETAFIFFICSIGGNVLSVLFVPHLSSSIVGASGGICGLLAVCWADIILNWDLLSMKQHDDGKVGYPRKVLVLLGIEGVLCFCMGLTLHVDNFAHVGGFCYGLCVGVPLLKHLGGTGFFNKSQKNIYGNISWYRRYSRIRLLVCRGFGMIFALILFISTTIVLARKDTPTSVCLECTSISCVPFPPFRNDKWWQCDGCDQPSAFLFKNNEDQDELELTCPYKGNILLVPILGAVPTDTERFQNAVSLYCRTHCAH